jgi:hypothetical protein
VASSDAMASRGLQFLEEGRRGDCWQPEAHHSCPVTIQSRVSSRHGRETFVGASSLRLHDSMMRGKTNAAPVRLAAGGALNRSADRPACYEQPWPAQGAVEPGVTSTYKDHENRREREEIVAPDASFGRSRSTNLSVDVVRLLHRKPIATRATSSKYVDYDPNDPTAQPARCVERDGQQ